MNRRTFLSSAGMVTAGAAATNLVMPRRLAAQSSGPSSTVYAASKSSANLTTANTYYNPNSASYWYDSANALHSAMNDWIAGGYDAQLKPFYGSIGPSQINSGAVNQQQALANIQVYQPAFQLPDLQNALSFLDSQSAARKSYVIGQCAQNGLSSFMQSGIDKMNTLAAYLMQVQPQIRAPRPALAQRIEQPPPPDGGGGGWSCEEDGAAIFMAGIAFFTLSVMTSGAFDVLAGAAWAGIGDWGTGLTIGYGAGHYISGCRF